MVINTRDFLHIILYEIKIQSRAWVYRLFVVLSLVGILAGHVYWQGQGNCMNWEMVALPCSMPLVNAYLFSVIQSLFLVVIMARESQRVNLGGALEAINVRPFRNDTYYLGMIFANFLLFLLVNLIVILASVFVVNLTSLAPVGWKYYIFYLLTLTIPAWVFVAGLTLGLSSVMKSRFLAIVFSVIWWMACIFWLPYWQHGTFDYLASGVPNLFSEMTGHLNFSRYTLHRLMYLFIGIGLLWWSVKMMKRLPNCIGVRKIYTSWGILFIVIGIFCGIFLEYSYYRDRRFRATCRDSFTRNWNEKTCRVSDHFITFKQSKEELTMRSEMIVYNPEKEPLERIVLFLNPGLYVTAISSGSENLEYRRDKQVILIDRPLAVGDSLRLLVDYGGGIDDRFCDLHLADVTYEDAFCHDRFFPIGRRGAFVEKNFLVLSPACAWYPVAIPPVNPLMIMATGRDFTRFRLRVERPRQKVIVSQGQPVKKEDAIWFEPQHVLNGISLCGANYWRYLMPVDENFGWQLNSVNWGKELSRKFSKVNREAFIALWSDPAMEGMPECKNYRGASWYSPKAPYLYLLEVPVSFRLDSHAGKSGNGLVEPGMIFLRERGFDMNIVEVMAMDKIKNRSDFFEVIRTLYNNIFGSRRKPKNNHPLLGIVKNDSKDMWIDVINDNSGASLWNVQPVWVRSLEYPFMGKVFNDLFLKDFDMAQGVLNAFDFSRLKTMYDYLAGRSLVDVLKDDEGYVFKEKLDDLWTRLTLKIPDRELRQCWDSLCDGFEGEVDYDSLVQAWTNRWSVDVGKIMKNWITTKHEQYFKVKDATCYYDPDTRRTKAVGKIMNVGKNGGVISIEHGSLMAVRRSICYFEPGEAKAFMLVTEDNVSSINTGLSSNRPTVFYFQWEKMERAGSFWEIGEEWHSIPISEFSKDENPNEIVVDDQDEGFSLVNGNLAWLQRWRKVTPPLVSNTQMGGDDKYWKRVINVNAYGDSIRGYHYICGGSGKSTATWRLNLPEAGRYRVMGKVHRAICTLGTMFPSGVVYYYMVSFGGRKENVEVNLDAELLDSNEESCWTSLGEFDFPAGEIRVMLSDKEIYERKEVAIVADAVKWIKLE